MLLLKFDINQVNLSSREHYGTRSVCNSICILAIGYAYSTIRAARYQGHTAVYSIHDGTVLAGELPPKKHKLVVAWVEIHQDSLVADWELAVNGKTPFPIRGLDQ